MLESSGSEIDDEIVLMLHNEKQTNIKHFSSVIEKYTEEQFRRHFRLRRSTLQIIVESYTRHCQDEGHSFVRLTPKMQVYMFVWYLVNTETFRQIGDRFGVSRGYAYKNIVKLAVFMANESKKYVKWPTLEEQNAISAGFQKISKIKNVVGAIDCSHIPIPKPKYHQEDYYNRKKFHSIQMQATVNHKKQITSVFVGEPGAMHDARVLRRSSLFQSVCERHNEMFLPRTFLLGDLAYPKTFPWLVPPFKRNQRLSNEKIQFNKLHSSSRIVVEQAFGLLKTRFRRLQKFGNIKKRLVAILVLSACGLHNLCIDRDDENVDDQNQNRPTPVPSHQITGITGTRQEELLLELIETNVIKTN